jgi:hypothetical protein
MSNISAKDESNKLVDASEPQKASKTEDRLKVKPTTNTKEKPPLSN